MRFHPLFNAMLSGRMDDNEYTNNLVSPRASVVSDVEDVAVFKLIAQKSVRMNSLDELYVAAHAGTQRQVETLKGIEFILIPAFRSERLSLTASTYYNRLNIIGYNNTRLATEQLGLLTAAHSTGIAPNLE